MRQEVKMQKVRRLNITISEEVYEALHRVVGPRKISKFIESLVRPYVVKEDLTKAYQEMAADRQREKEAKEWTEGLIGNLDKIGFCD